MICGAAPLINIDLLLVKAANATISSYSQGDIIGFGWYPQNKITDSDTIAALNAKDGEWISYGYYSGTGDPDDGNMVSGDYMRYKDVVYGSNKYRGVVFDTYRPCNTSDTTSTSADTYQDDNSYTCGNVYWFRYEPIEWRVLDPDTGMIMAETILDSQAYNNYILYGGTDEYGYNAHWGDSSKTYYANNYANSSIREWLNEDFYNIAFSTAQQEIIEYTTLDNSAHSESYSAYDSVSTTDKIYLLSWDDVLNTEYGFSSDYSDYDIARMAQGSDYAKSQGLRVSLTSSNYYGNSWWWLRTPAFFNSWACCVDYNGFANYSGDGVNCDGVGVRPALNLNTTAEIFQCEVTEVGNASTGGTTSEDIYNLGEETYCFENFGDSDSKGGHCFGMSMTSSAYYIGELDITDVGGNETNDLYTLSLTNKVKAPICKYQAIQGSYSVNATVAGGCYYKNSYYDIVSDWNAVVDYVENHNYDNKGILQIGFRKDGEGGHAINFLHYEEVDGQPRIYAYDNNFPDRETYFYQDSNGDIRQAPSQTFSGTIDCIALRDVSKYFGTVDNFDSTRYIYADRDVISVTGVKVYPIDVDGESGERVVFEIPANVDRITITPLVNNADFVYLDEEYSFGTVNDDTVAVFKLASNNENSTQSPEMTIISKSDIASVSIKTPSTTTISYGDAIILHADAVNLPAGAHIEWTSNNGNFDMSVSSDGKTCKISPSSSGSSTITATIYDASGNAVSKDEQTMTSKAGFFDKLVAFFKGLFGLTKTIER